MYFIIHQKGFQEVSISSEISPDYGTARLIALITGSGLLIFARKGNSKHLCPLRKIARLPYCASCLASQSPLSKLKNLTDSVGSSLGMAVSGRVARRLVAEAFSGG